MKEKEKKITTLKKCREEYLARKNDSDTKVIFRWKDGTQGGIVNPEMTKKIMQFCADEAQRQIDELEGRVPEKFHVALLFGEYAVQEYESGGIEGLNSWLEGEEFPDLDIRERHFDTKEQMQAYLDGINEFAGDERAPGDWCVMDYDDLNKIRYE